MVKAGFVEKNHNLQLIERFDGFVLRIVDNIRLVRIFVKSKFSL